MTGPVESLTQQLVHEATNPFGLAILTGVAASSFWFFGGLALALDGALAATITESERDKRGVSVASALKLWEWMFNRAKVGFFSPGLPSLCLLTAYPCRNNSLQLPCWAPPLIWSLRCSAPTYDLFCTAHLSCHSQSDRTRS